MGYGFRRPRKIGDTDLKDRHVASAAIAVAPSVLLTYNIKDFDIKALETLHVTVQPPGEFLCGLLEAEPEAVRDAILFAALQSSTWTRPALRVGSKTQWLHVACTALLTFYRVFSFRGSVLQGVSGIIVHDHWKPYYTITGVLHALCNAHHLCEFKALETSHPSEKCPAPACLPSSRPKPCVLRMPLRAVKGSAPGLPVDRDRTFDCTAQSLGPCDKALLKRLDIQRSEDQTKLVVARRPVRKGQEPAKKWKFALAIIRYADPAVSLRL